VRAAFEAQDEQPAVDPTTSVFAAQPNPIGGMGGGMAGAGMAPGQSATMLQQSFGPSDPVGAAPSDAIFTGGNSAGAGAGPVASASGDVFTGGNNAFNNRYTPSVGTAMGSSDTLVSVSMVPLGEGCRKRIVAAAVYCGAEWGTWLLQAASGQHPSTMLTALSCCH
jgi:hypothetical protein